MASALPDDLTSTFSSMAARPVVVERSGRLNDMSRAESALYGTLVPGATRAAATAQLRTLTEELPTRTAVPP